MTDLGVVEVDWSTVPDATGYSVYESTNAAWSSAIGSADLAGLDPVFVTASAQSFVETLGAGEIRWFAVTADLAGGLVTAPSRPLSGGAPADALLGLPVRLFGSVDGAQLGLSLTAGDVNGDGRSDLIAGQPIPFNNLDDRVAAYLTRGAFLDTSASIASDTFVACATGWSVAYAGDLDGDGFGDTLDGCTAIASGPTFDGSLYAAPGGPAGLASAQAAVAISPPQSERSLGWELAALGDTDGDGLGETALAIPWLPGIDRPADSYGGAVLVLEAAGGGTVTQSASFVASGGSAGDEFGEALAVRSPGILAVGEPDRAGAGTGGVRIFQIAGNSMNELSGERIDAPPGAVGFGRALAAAGTTVGSAPDQLLVGAAPTNGGIGFASLWSGTTELWEIPVQAPTLGAYAHEVRWLAGGQDVNGDGYDDVLVGEPAAGGGAGSVSLYLGGPDDVSVSPAWTVSGEQTERLGDQVMLTDLDGDGRPEIVASGTEWERVPGTQASTRGEVRVWRSSAGQGLRVDAGGLVIAPVFTSAFLGGALFSDPRQSGPYQVLVDWGDGAGLLPVDPCQFPGQPALSCASHYYGSVGAFRIRVRVEAADGRTGEASTSIEVR